LERRARNCGGQGRQPDADQGLEADIRLPLHSALYSPPPLPEVRASRPRGLAMRYTAWPLWRNHGALGDRWVSEIFEEEGSTVIDRLPLKELLNKARVARVLDGA
jgi:hypothetical protein